MISSIGQYNYASSATAMPQRPSPEEMFNQMDSNGDGAVDKAEFTAFGQLMASKIGKPDKSEEIFAKIDTDGDGKISQSENEAWLSQMEANRPQGPPPNGGMDPEEMFAQMDTDSDGYVTETEFEAFREQMKAEMQSMLLNTPASAKADSNNDSNSMLSSLAQRYSLSQTTDASSLVDMLG